MRSSGLLLIASAFEAYYCVKLQLNAETLMREYVLLSYGQISLEVLDVDACVFLVYDMTFVPRVISRR